MRIVSLVGFLTAVLLFAGCSGSGTAIPRTEYQENLGSTTMNNLITYADETFLTNYGYRYQRREADNPENIYLETEWQPLTPTADEQALGVQNVRTRFVIQARPRNRTTGDVTASLTAETQYQRSGSSEWVDAPMTEERLDYVQDIADYLKTELRSNWR